MTDSDMAPPMASLLVIRSSDIHRAVEFYRTMGMVFDLHAHGTGPEHYASEVAGFVFEIYPKGKENDDTRRTRFGFRVDDVDSVVQRLRGSHSTNTTSNKATNNSTNKATIVTEPADTPWGRRAVVQDFDGHTVELVTPPDHGTKDDATERKDS